MVLGDWEPRPIENLVKGDEVYIYCPEYEPQVFRAIFSELKRGFTHGRSYGTELIGITYHIPEGDPDVFLIAKGKPQLRNSNTFTYYAPKNRVGFHKYFEPENWHLVQDYNN